MSSATVTVCVVRGVFNPLLSKLTGLLGEEYKKLKGVRKQASFLRDELSAMKALLDKMERMDKLDSSAKDWRGHVREMSYDMENCIDDCVHNTDHAHAKTGFARKMAKGLRRLGRRHQIADKIKELKDLALEVNARRERYNIDECVNTNPGTVAVDPRISSIYKEATSLVGIDGPREELGSLLMMDSLHKNKVVSIVGSGGLGKTTLVKQVYDEMQGAFDCKAFVSVSQRPDIKGFLIRLQRRLGMEESLHAHEEQDIIDRLREYLKHKRYIIVVDDLWDQEVWRIISCAFLENNKGSRVMVTTRLDSVAAAACNNDRSCIYTMKHLEEQDSRTLFFNIVFGSENVCPPQFTEVSAEFLKRCGGLPLAIITTASMLASKRSRSVSEWKCIKDSLSAKVATESTVEEMRGILNLSYMHLPIHLRPCLLYLGMYHEDHEIEKNDLAQQWIAEGFVCNLHGPDLVDVAKSYFNELINRCLIQPERTIYGEVQSCRVHDMILDLILSKTAEDNFLNVAYKYEDMAGLQGCEHKKVRRLSLKSRASGATSESLATSMPQVRSYAQFGDFMRTPPLTQFRYLRVLLFELPDEGHMTVDLTAIGHLFLLRYLKVLAGYADAVLPAKIQGLVHLETMELVCSSTQGFPSDITSLGNLFHLILPYGRVLPEGIGNMKSLRTLHCSGISESSLEDIKGLGELTSLKELDLSGIQRLTADRVEALVSSVGMLQELNCLALDCQSECDGYDMQLDSLADPPPLLEVLDLESWSCRVPRWIGGLRFLRILSLHVLHLTNDEVRVLGELPSLVSISFRKFDISQENAVVGTGLFPNLEYFSFNNGDITAHLGFEEGAMPKILG